jgi:hypothetical protein
MKKSVLSPLLVLVALSASAEPQVATIDPAVDSVVSGGYWIDGMDRGTYRVIVRSGGFDHITSEITIEWLSEPRDEDEEASVHKSVVVKEGEGLWKAVDPELKVDPTDGKTFLDWKAIDTHDQSERECRVELSSNGSYHLVKACK